MKHCEEKSFEWIPYNKQLVCLPFLQDSDVIITSAPNCRQQSAIFSSSVATTRTRENYQSEIKEAS